MSSDGEKTVQNIIGNYISKEKSIVNQLNFKMEHPTTIGGFREEIWKEMFEEMIMFTPTYDKLFDKGLISFQDDGTLIVSKELSEKVINILLNFPTSITVENA